MESILHPLTFGQILDRTFRLCRANLKSLLSISALPAVGFLLTLLAVLGTVLPAVLPDRGTPPSVGLGKIVLIVSVSLVAMVGMMLVFALYQPAACYAALQADLGLPTRFREAYEAALSKLGRYVWLNVLKGVIVAGPFYGTFILLVLLSMFRARAAGSGVGDVLAVVVPLLMLVYVCGMVYAVFMMIRLALAVPACVAEDLPAYAGIRRSFQLTRNAKGRIFLVALVVYAANYAAMMIFEIMFGAIASAGALLFVTTHLSLTTQIVAASVPGVFFLGGLLLLMGAMWTTFVVAFTVVYRDQRVRLDPKPTPHAADWIG